MLPLDYYLLFIICLMKLDDELSKQKILIFEYFLLSLKTKKKGNILTEYHY